MPVVIEKDSLYTPAEVAGFLRCSKTNVYDLIARNDIAVVRIGASKGYRITGEAVLEFIRSRTEGGPAPVTRFKHLKI